MKNRVTDDPRNLDRERQAWDWCRTAGLTDQELCEMLIAGPRNAPRRRAGEAGRSRETPSGE
jgi:hypothetical protein